MMSSNVVEEDEPMIMDTSTSTTTIRYPPLWKQVVEDDQDDCCHRDDDDDDDLMNDQPHQPQHYSFNHQLQCLSDMLSLDHNKRHKNILHYRKQLKQNFIQVARKDIIVMTIPPTSFCKFQRKGMVIGQQLSLICLILKLYHYLLCSTNNGNDHENEICHLKTVKQEDLYKFYILFALGILFLMLIGIYGEGVLERASKFQRRRQRAKTRFCDAMLLALWCRIFSSLLKSLTASYSSDTVSTLALYGMLLHILTCDYHYACGGSQHSTQHPNDDDAIVTGNEQESATSNDKRTRHRNQHQQRRPKFLGGTVSLNGAFFSVILFASRLPNDVTAFAFIIISIIVFAFYPDTRHRIASAAAATTSTSTAAASSFSSWMTSFLPELMYILLSLAALTVLWDNNHNNLNNDEDELDIFYQIWSMTGYTSLKILFIVAQCFLSIIAPLLVWNQQTTQRIKGPWEIAQVNTTTTTNCSATTTIKKSETAGKDDEPSQSLITQEKKRQ